MGEPPALAGIFDKAYAQETSGSTEEHPTSLLISSLPKLRWALIRGLPTRRFCPAPQARSDRPRSAGSLKSGVVRREISAIPGE